VRIIKSRAQNGFAVVEAMILLVVIGLVAIGIWWVYHHNQSRAVSDVTVNTSTQPLAKPLVTYLEIKEWGIKLPLSEEIKDAYYIVPQGIALDTDGLPSGIILGIHSLDSSCGEVTSESPGFNNSFAEIVRALPNEKNPISGRLYKELLPSGVTINGYYYGYSRMTENKTCATRTELDSIDSAIAVATQGLLSAK